MRSKTNKLKRHIVNITERMRKTPKGQLTLVFISVFTATEHFSCAEIEQIFFHLFKLSVG